MVESPPSDVPSTKLPSFWANPVFEREIRVRMRGPRSFWNQAAFLLAFCILTFAGYASSIRLGNTTPYNAVAAHDNIWHFYYWLFVSIALLISFVAPALTVSSIITEKDQKTIDLLVTTPITSTQLLTGKLLSAMAFVLLLLVLTIPMAVFCIAVGAATIQYVLQSYALIIIDAFLMATIGLSFSCICKHNIPAIFGAIVTILLLLFATFNLATTILRPAYFTGLGHGHAVVPALASLFELDPLFAVTVPMLTVSVGGITIPLWAVTAIVCFIIVRLTLTGNSLRLGMYESGLTASLRRQILVATVIGAFIVGQGMGRVGDYADPRAAEQILTFVCFGEFIIGALFFATLFVPVVPEDVELQKTAMDSFDICKAFSTEHSGALPYFLIWLF
jgi:ABC-type transport system involved in multi-copper enzyme maturation permease subunit